MYCCKDLFELSVLSLYEGDLLGKVDKLYFDKKLKKLVELELVGLEGARLSLPTKNIYRVGKNAITVKNNQMIAIKERAQDLVVAPMESKVYSISGEFLGVVKDLCLNEKFITEKLTLEKDIVLNVSDLLSCGKNTVIFNTKDKKISAKNFVPINEPKTFKVEIDQHIKTLPIETDNKQIVPVENKPTNIQNTDFLVGRICVKNIFNFNNELLVKEKTVITKKILKEICKYGKLRELMLYIK